MKKHSAGLLMYRIKNGEWEVLLVHPGGPFWKNKDHGAWSVPKGMADEGEEGGDMLVVAKREFEEETGVKPEGDFEYLTSVKRKDGKVVDVWTFEGECDTSKIKSNLCEIEWPPRSGQRIEIPEVDKGEFFTIKEAKEKINAYQLGIIEAFEQKMRHVDAEK